MKDIEHTYAEKIEKICQSLNEDIGETDSKKLLLELEQILGECAQYRKNIKSNTAFILKK